MASQAPERGSNRWLVLITVMVGTLLIGLDRTVVNLAVPKIISTFGITIATAGWVATAYIISNSVFVPIFGKLGDLEGDKRIYVGSFIGFIILSVLAGLAWDYTALVVFRVLQGLVGAAVYPTAMSLIAKTFTKPHERAQALGIWSSSFAISAVIGPLVGGTLIDNFSWRMIFYINLPIGIIGLVMALMLLRDDKPDKTRDVSFDVLGASLIALTISSLVLVLEKGQDWGWGSASSLALFAVFALGLVLTWLRERVAQDPIVDLRFLRNGEFIAIISVTLVVFSGMMGAMFLLPVFAQSILQLDAIKTGLMFMPMALTIMFVAPIGARLTSRVGPKVPVGVGILLASLGMFLMSRAIDPAAVPRDFILPLFTLGAGLGMTFAPLTSTVTTIFPTNEVGIASGIFNLMRNVAGAFGIAVFSSLLTTAAGHEGVVVARYSHISAYAPPAVQGLAHGLAALSAEVGGFSVVFRIASMFMVLGSVVAFLVLKSGPQSHPDGESQVVMGE